MEEPGNLSLTPAERSQMIGLSNAIVQAKAQLFDARTSLERAQERYLGGLSLLAATRGIDREVSLSPDGSTLVSH